MEFISSRRKATLVVTIMVTALFVYSLWLTSTFSPSMLPGYPGDAFFPRLILVFGLIWCGVLIYKFGIASNSDERHVEEEEQISLAFIPVALICGFVLAYLYLLPVIGFEACTFLLMFLLLFPRWKGELGARVIQVSLISLVTMAVTYFSFVILLNVSFPVKFLPDFIQF